MTSCADAMAAREERPSEAHPVERCSVLGRLLHFARRAAGRDPSPFYNLERQLTDGYDNYTSVFKRFGRLEGGVPGLDF
jgi:hypothetical protein